VSWTWWRVALAAVLALAVAAAAFALRFNALGGTMGGFDNDHFVHLVRTDLLLNGEQPLRDFADAELRGAWPSLGYGASAWAQEWWGRTLLSEAYLTIGGLALTAAGVFLLALHLSGRWSVAFLAVACVLASHPKLYNYEKLLVLFVGAALVRLWILRPSSLAIAALAVWTAVAGLVRHDYAVYVGAAAATALLLRGPDALPLRARRVAIYAGLTLLLLVPSVVWVQQHAGLIEYAERSLASIRGESSRTALVWPRFGGGGWSEDNLAAVTYYGIWLLVAAAAAVLVLQWSRRALDAASLATGAAIVVLAALAGSFFLRGNLFARFGDAIVPVVLAAAWLAGTLGGVPTARRITWGLVPQALLLVLAASLFVGTEMRYELEAAGFTESWERTRKRFEDARADLMKLPPHAWSAEGVHGTMVASRYLAECTTPEDRVLMATYAPEVPVLARRLVAAGQGTFGLTFYESDTQQDEAVARLARQSVPVVLGAFDDFEGEFADDYRRVYGYVAEHYRDAGVIPVDGRPRFRVLVDADRAPARRDPVFGLPCFTNDAR
jgi:hypothetical protein